ncbi:MAG: hypothetical protein U1E52_13965 [Geminicoccaceae bacterium]
MAGQRWRTTIARLSTGETVGRVNVGSAAAFTGAAVRSAARNAGFVVIVSLEGALRDPVSTGVLVRFTGPFVTVIGPRPNNGDGCRGDTDAVVVAPRPPAFSTLNIFGEPYTSPATN